MNWILALGLVAVVALTPGDSSLAQEQISLGELFGTVVMEDETRLVLDQRGRVQEAVRRVVRVADGAAQERFGVLVLGHDTFRSVRSVEGRVLDADGRTVRQLKRGDVEDYPATASFSLYDDNRVRVARLYHDTFPYTIVWEYEIEHEGLLNWPTWRPQRSEEAVLHASLTVEVPSGTSLRYLADGLDLTPSVEKTRRTRTYRWEGAFAPWAVEPVGPSRWDQSPKLHLATDEFTMAGHSGSLATWGGLAAWYGGLTYGRDRLPPDAFAEVRALVEGVEDPRERARRVYGYLQGTVRYVSVQLGIGGWQPFPAAYVYERRYGDCKALTNYLAAMLAVADVPAFPALIGHGRPDLDPDFPRNAFNHVVLYVPLADGDLWLEATSQTIPFGFLGSGSEDRWALVVESGGGRLVRTPASAAGDNRQVRSAQVQLAASGQALVRAETRYAGHPLGNLRDALGRRSDRERQAWWKDRLGLAADGLAVEFRDGEDVAAARTDVALPRYATIAGSRMLFRPNVFERWTSVPPESPERRQPVVLGYPFEDVDTVRVELPVGYTVEALPEPVRVEAPFGRYAAEVTHDGEALVYARSVAVTARNLPPEDYDAYRRFVQTVVQTDDVQVVLRRDR